MTISHALNAGALQRSAESVDSDFAALAFHMNACARSRGPLFRLRTMLQTGKAIAARRIVTFACVACVAVGAAAALVVIV